MKLTQKKARAIVDQIFNRIGNRRQFPIFDLAKISKAGIDALMTGGELAAETAVA